MLDFFLSGAPGSPRTLAGLCDRVALSLDAGIDVRRVWRSEVDRLSGRGSRACEDVATAIEAGEGLDAAIAGAGPFFPPLLVELVRVGEHSGSTTEVFRRLADHYQGVVSRAGEFRSAIAWPLLQLLAALAIVGVLIAIGGVLQDGQGQPLDFLGLGLTGPAGLVTYAFLLGGIGTATVLGWLACLRQPAWGDWFRAKLTLIPVVGPALRKLALARIAWALRLTMNVEMDLRKVAPVVLRASGNARYARHGVKVAVGINQGKPLSECFAKTKEFPKRFLDTLEVAETTGTIVESMDRLSRQYDEEADHAIAVLSRVAAFVIWAAIATLVVLLIFRVFGFYTGVLNEALEGF